MPAIDCERKAAGLPVMLNDTHIVPVMVDNSEERKEASDLLLAEHGIYLQPINYPTVPRGAGRLRIAATPYQDDVLIDRLAEALVDVWARLSLPLRRHALAAEWLAAGKIRSHESSVPRITKTSASPLSFPPTPSMMSSPLLHVKGLDRTRLAATSSSFWCGALIFRLEGAHVRTIDGEIEPP